MPQLAEFFGVSEDEKLYLFILESIGTQELILIGIIALIVFGPRKLPQFAKTIGKTMADFRKVTHEFKSTWEKEVEEDAKLLKTLGEDPLASENVIGGDKTNDNENETLAAPQVKELSTEEIAKMFPDSKTVPTEPAITENAENSAPLSKKDWL